jgi:hypothetical protein
MTAAFNQLLAQGVTPIKFENPVNQMAQIMQLKNAQQTGVVNQMAIDKGQRQQADQAALRNMLGQTDFNVNDPNQRARVLGYEGGADIVSALNASALNQSKLTEANNKAVASGILNSQNLMANVDTDAQDAVPRLKAIMSATFQNPEVAKFFATHGQTEQGVFDSIDQAASLGKLKGWHASAMSNAESVRKRMESQGTPQSPVAKMQADLARLPQGSPERAALEAAISKAGQFAPSATINMAPGEKAFDVAAGKAGAAKTLAQSDAASGAQTEIDNANEIIRLAPTAITGFGEDYRLKAAKFGQAIGLEDLFNPDGKIVDSETLGIKLGTKVLQEAKGAGAVLGAGKSFTDKDLAMVAKVAGGSSALEAPTLIIMAKIAKEVAQKKYNNYRKTYGALSPENKKMFFDPTSDLADESATAPSASKAATPAPIQIKNNEEWAKLPVGQEFLDPNGVKRVKQ